MQRRGSTVNKLLRMTREGTSVCAVAARMGGGRYTPSPCCRSTLTCNGAIYTSLGERYFDINTMKSYPVKRTVKHMEKQAVVFCAPKGAAVVSPTLSSTVVRVTMDFFQHRYYRLNKLLMMFIGQWPYQSTGARHSLLVAVIFLGSNQVVPMTLALVKNPDEKGIVLDFALPVLFGGVYFFKLVGFMLHAQKTIMLLNRIRTDWYEWARDQEVNILHQYAEQGRKMTIGYLAMGITSFTIFIIQPSIPKIIDIFLKNGTKPGKFPYPVDYYHLDVQKYYFYITAFSYISVSMTTMVVITHSVMLICYTQHVCGILAALGHKLERLGNRCTSVATEETGYARDKIDIGFVASCINRHNHAFEYANLIVESYTRTFFITVGLGAILLNVIGLQILMRANDPASTMRYIVFVWAIMLYFFIECYISEKLLDHSIGIYFSIHNSQWYTLPLKSQRLLQFMIMRCSVPCQLTAGKMMVMSMRSWWLTLKTTTSYLMIVRSMQGL